MEGREIAVSSSTANRETDSPLSQPLPIAVVVPQEGIICGGVGNGLDMRKGKKKRGRPRKYGPQGSIAMAASQGFSSPPSEFAMIQNRGPPAPLLVTGSGNQQLIPHFGSEESTSSAFSQGFASPASEFSPKKIRGPPPQNSGDRKPTPPLGELVVNVEGRDLTPHVVTIHTGENVAAKLISFMGPRAVCILSANGFVFNVTIRQPSSSDGILTYEGSFEILTLFGSFTTTDNGVIRSTTSGLSVTVAGADGRVIGGALAGRLIAASPIQVVVGSFKSNDKSHKRKNDDGSPMPSATPDPQDVASAARPITQPTPDDDTSATPTSALLGQGHGDAENSASSNLNPNTGFQSADCYGTMSTQEQTLLTLMHV